MIMGNFEEAEQLLKDSQSKDPNNVHTMLSLAACYAQQVTRVFSPAFFVVLIVAKTGQSTAVSKGHITGQAVSKTSPSGSAQQVRGRL